MMPFDLTYLHSESPNIQLSVYQHQYRAQIIELILKIQQEEFEISISLDDQPDLQNISDFYQKENGNFWIALDGDKVIGTIAAIDIGNCRLALRKMFVAANYRGKHVGTGNQLLYSLLSWAKAKDIQEIYLGTTGKFKAAHRFYEKNGFIEINKSDLPATFPLMQVDTKFYKLSLMPKSHAK